MCGICGTVGRADEFELNAMAGMMAHRGPDGDGVVLFHGATPAGLGHRRLAIIDPVQRSAQPMVFADRWWITFNGEIYNYRELRAELEAKGERFRTESDTEVLLRLFALYGEEALARLNGMFAFAIWDDVEQRLFLARDRLGIKPLYYTRADGVFAFASEVRPLLPLLGRPTLDLVALADYLTFLWVPEPRTAFTAVAKLPAGHCGWVDADGMTSRAYWNLEFAPEELPEREWVGSVRDCVTRSVRRQMVSDVPLGSFLSGGVDSSAVVAAMAGDGRKVSTYTIGFEREDLAHEIAPDDLPYAREVGTRFGVDYHEEIIHPDVLDLLPQVVSSLEEPIADPAAISTYLVCRAARRTMPVMLSGMGADEIFAGYPRYLAYRISRWLDPVPDTLLRPARAALGPLGRPGRPGRLRGPRRNLWKFLRGAALPPLDRYLSFSSYYSAAELTQLLSDDAAAAVAGHDPLSVHRQNAQDAGQVDELARLLYVDAKTFLPSLNLAYTDKMSMAASVEVRVPLLDDELVALAARIPSHLKLKGTRRKYIFKRSQEGVLPRDVIWRPKAGFGVPIRSWMVSDLRPLVDELLSTRTIRDRGLFDADEVARLRADNDSGLADNSLRMYALLSMELWAQQFVDRDWHFERPAAPSTTGIAP